MIKLFNYFNPPNRDEEKNKLFKTQMFKFQLIKYQLLKHHLIKNKRTYERENKFTDEEINNNFLQSIKKGIKLKHVNVNNYDFINSIKHILEINLKKKHNRNTFSYQEYSEEFKEFQAEIFNTTIFRYIERVNNLCLKFCIGTFICVIYKIII